MLTGDYEKDKAELERLIAHEQKVLFHEQKVLFRHGQAVNVALASLSSYRHQLQALEREQGR